MDLAGIDGESKGFLVHVGVHEKFPAPIICRDGWNEPIGIKFGSEFAALLNLFNGDTW
jgi:hypothetical protein